MIDSQETKEPFGKGQCLIFKGFYVNKQSLVIYFTNCYIFVTRRLTAEKKQVQNCLSLKKRVRFHCLEPQNEISNEGIPPIICKFGVDQ